MMRSIFSSLQNRIFAYMITLVVLCTLASMFLTASLLYKSHLDSVKRQLEATGASLTSLGITKFSELEDFYELNSFIDNALQMEKVDRIVRIFDQSRELMFTTVGAAYDVLPAQLEAEVKKPSFFKIEGQKEQYESLVIPYKGGSKQFYLQVAMPLPKYHEILALFMGPAVGLLLALLAVAFLAAQRLSVRLAKPVRIIGEHLQAMDPVRIEEWKAIPDVERGQYLGPITSGINLLIKRTKASVRKLWAMSRYISHELRNPLTIMKGEADIALARRDATKADYERVIRSSLEEIERMSEIVTAVLKVGEDERIFKNFKPVTFDLAKWIEQGKASWEATLMRPIEFRCAFQGPVEVSLDPNLLSRMIDNLVRNVRDYTPAGTACRLVLDTHQARPALILTDEGPGMPGAILDALAHPEGPLEPAHIGLTLCRRIAEVCGLNLGFVNRPEGGLEVRITF